MKIYHGIWTLLGYMTGLIIISPVVDIIYGLYEAFVDTLVGKEWKRKLFR